MARYAYLTVAVLILIAGYVVAWDPAQAVATGQPLGDLAGRIVTRFTRHPAGPPAAGQRVVSHAKPMGSLLFGVPHVRTPALDSVTDPACG